MKSSDWDRRRSTPPSREGGLRKGHLRPTFWILTGFLVLVFATGGSSRVEAPLLFVLRPIAILVAAYGLATLRPEHRRAYRHPLLLASAVVLLTAAHLIPLPPALWHALPSRELVRGIDAAAGLEGQWRPLSLTPSRTLNALYALSIPIATLLLAVQLTGAGRVRILYVLLGLAAVSALVGLLQSVGMPISLFHTVRAPRTVEATGLFANQNHQAALLASMIPMLAVAARLGGNGGTPRRMVEPLAAASAVGVIILLIVTGSRTGLVLGAVAIAFALFYGLLQVDRLDRLPRRTASAAKLALGAAVVGAAVLVTVLAARGLALRRLETVGADLRPKLWASIVSILPDYQPWGSGIGSYVEVYRSREPAALLRETYSNHAHNEFLEIALTAGAPGLLLLAAAIALVLRALWRNRGGREPEALLARVGGAVIVILACASLTDYPLRTPLMSAVLALAATWCARPTRSEARARGGG